MLLWALGLTTTGAFVVFAGAYVVQASTWAAMRGRLERPGKVMHYRTVYRLAYLAAGIVFVVWKFGFQPSPS